MSRKVNFPRRPRHTGPASAPALALAFAIAALVAIAPWRHVAFVAGRVAGAPVEALERSLVARRFFENPFEVKPPAPPVPPVVINEDYKIAGIFVALGLVMSAALPFAGLGLGVFILLLGVLFYVQAGRVRFVFDGDSFEVRTLEKDGSLKQEGKNFAVGGDNRWAYSSFVNWEFFPKGFVEQGLPPVLVYFKETQTPSDKWGVGPGELANSEEAVANGAVRGQVHFFPCICDAQQIKSEFEKRGCKKLNV